MKKKYIYVGKRDWGNLRLGYDIEDLIRILDDKFGYKHPPEVKNIWRYSLLKQQTTPRGKIKIVKKYINGAWCKICQRHLSWNNKSGYCYIHTRKESKDIYLKQPPEEK